MCSFCNESILENLQEPYERGLKQVNEIFLSSTHLVDLCKEKTYNVKKRRAFASLLKVLEQSGLSKHKVYFFLHYQIVIQNDHECQNYTDDKG